MPFPGQQSTGFSVLSLHNKIWKAKDVHKFAFPALVFVVGGSVDDQAFDIGHLIAKIVEPFTTTQEMVLLKPLQHFIGVRSSFTLGRRGEEDCSNNILFSYQVLFSKLCKHITNGIEQF